MALETEVATYEQMKADLLRNHLGKFVVIKGTEFLGTFDTAGNAYDAGVKKYGKEPFLVRRVSEKEETYENQALSLGLIHADL
jgi:hypothetical protein